MDRKAESAFFGEKSSTERFEGCIKCAQKLVKRKKCVWEKSIN